MITGPMVAQPAPSPAPPYTGTTYLTFQQYGTTNQIWFCPSDSRGAAVSVNADPSWNTYNSATIQMVATSYMYMGGITIQNAGQNSTTNWNVNCDGG